MENTSSASINENTKTWDLKLAKFITNLISPPLVSVLGLFALAASIGGKSVWYWTFFFVFVLIVLPTSYTVWLYKTGRVTAIFLPVRENRVKVIYSMILFNAIGLIGMLVGKAPFVLTAFAVVGILQSTIILLITKYWKISAHTTGISGLAVFLTGIFGWSGAPVLLIIPLVSWARIRLDSHSFWQVAGGVILGTVFIGTATVLLSFYCGGFNLTCG
jgi:membrane-associated phospholipid phosphatase